MVNNNKGAILLVTIVSMMILTIIGYITLQMASSQAVTDTYDQAKIRTEYAAEGMVERARGYIEYVKVKYSTVTASSKGDVGFGSGSGKGYLVSMTMSSPHERWFLLENAEDGNEVKEGHVFDSSMYPYIYAGDIYCEHVNGSESEPLHGIAYHNSGTERTYRIVCVAYATVNSADTGMIVSTATYYFYTKHESPTDTDGLEKHDTKYFYLGWRRS